MTLYLPSDLGVNTIKIHEILDGFHYKMPRVFWFRYQPLTSIPEVLYYHISRLPYLIKCYSIQEFTVLCFSMSGLSLKLPKELGKVRLIISRQADQSQFRQTGTYLLTYDVSRATNQFAYMTWECSFVFWWNRNFELGISALRANRHVWTILCTACVHDVLKRRCIRLATLKRRLIGHANLAMSRLTSRRYFLIYQFFTFKSTTHSCISQIGFDSQVLW